MHTPKRLLIIYHSRTGGTQQMAEAFLAGARLETAVHSQMLPAQSTHAEDLWQADGYAFACPENLAAISGVMKDFFDRCYYGALYRIEGRPYASLVCAGSDGSNAARQIARIVTGWRLQAVAPPLIVCTHAQTPDAIAAPKTLTATDWHHCHELGQAMATGLSLGIF